MNISLKEVLLTQFDREMGTGRKLLERVPAEKLDWAPHAKSMPLIKLAYHLTQLPGMGADVVLKDELSFTGSGPSRPEIKSAADLVAIFDEKAKATRDALAATTDEHLSGFWKLSYGDHKIFEGSRFMAFQTLLLNHFIHHRAQLGVYLRLNEVAIPGSYGPSADEKM